MAERMVHLASGTQLGDNLQDRPFACPHESAIVHVIGIERRETRTFTLRRRKNGSPSVGERFSESFLKKGGSIRQRLLPNRKDRLRKMPRIINRHLQVERQREEIFFPPGGVYQRATEASRAVSVAVSDGGFWPPLVL